jgi:hypothetical protein
VAHGWHGKARGGRGAMGRRVNENRCGTTLSASWEAVMSHVGEIDCFHGDGFPCPPSPPPLWGLPAATARHWCRRGGAIPTTFLAPEEAPRPWQTPWLSLQGWTPAFVGEKEVVATMVATMFALAACQSLQWMASREQEGGGGGRSNKVVVMLPHGVRSAGSRQHDKKRGGKRGHVR